MKQSKKEIQEFERNKTFRNAELNQKPQPRILTFTKPQNIRGSVHGKITAYQELWNYVESLRYNNHNLEKNPIIYKARNSILNPIFSNIICELKSLGCSEVGFAEKWIDND